MMEPEDTEIQKLIRLKRYEQPPPGFVDDFISQFHYRQRSEILRQSSFSLFWDRLTAFMDGRSTQATGLAFAMAAVLLVGGSMMWSPGSSKFEGGMVMNNPATDMPHAGNTFSSAGLASFGTEDGPQDSASDHTAEQLANSLSPDVLLSQGIATVSAANGTVQGGSADHIDKTQLISPHWMGPVLSPLSDVTKAPGVGPAKSVPVLHQK